MAEAALPNEGIRRRRERTAERRYSKDRRAEIVQRVLEFYRRDLDDRTADQDARLELFAKINGMISGDAGLPWEGASDIDLPDIRSAVLKTEDDLVNRSLSSRPIATARARSPKQAPMQRPTEQLLDTQMFDEQDGEKIIHELANGFTNDGAFIAFVPWIEERRDIVELDTFPASLDMSPKAYFLTLLENRFPGTGAEMFEIIGSEGWSWRIKSDSREYKVEFYTKSIGEGEDDYVVEREVKYESVVFDGPRVLVKDYEDVLTPPRSANLQPRTVSNPQGAPHVLVVDYPSVDEIRNLKRSGWYGMMSKEDLKKAETKTRGLPDEPEKQQRDAKQGTSEAQEYKDVGQRTVTRITCFDAYSFGEGEPAEDMIWVVLMEPGVLAKTGSLTEHYPVSDGEMPSRPFATAAYLEVKGRWQGESLPAIMESSHDYLKVIWDQMADAGTLQNLPFFFYRPSSSQAPDIIDLEPGSGYPLEDPSGDINFPNMQNNAMAFGLNVISTLNKMQEELTLQGELQSGRVPQGQSAALRTSGGIQQILAQGEARPERVLRRFFRGVLDIYKLMHRQNQFRLPDEKVFRYSGFLEPGENPYVAVKRSEIRAARMELTFVANIQNSSLTARQQSLDAATIDVTNPLSLQIGITDPNLIYRLMRDRQIARGLDPDRYYKPPSPQAIRPQITAHAALEEILHERIPDGEPLEGAKIHKATLDKLLDTPVDLGAGTRGIARQFFDESKLAILESYQERLAVKIQQEEAAEAEVQAARDAQAGRPQQGGPPQQGAPRPDVGPATLSGPNELLDESLPTAGGGANQDRP